MNSKQQPRSQMPTKNHPPPSTHNTKSQQFMNHFHSLKNSAAYNQKTSSATTTDRSRIVDYSQVIQQYSQKQSNIEQVTSMFNNQQICDLFAQPLPFATSNSHFTLPSKITASIVEVSQFFNYKTPLVPKAQDFSFLNVENYSQYLASSITPAAQLQLTTVKTERNQQIKSQFITIEKQESKSAPIHTKIDLLLAQLISEKRRKKDNFYEESVAIKLSQFIDYLTQDDQRYLGLALQQKAKQITTNIHEYEGKTIDNYLKLPLLQYFFIELRQLRQQKLLKLKSTKQARQKHETCSQLQKHSGKSQKSQGGKYSEPRGKKRQLKEQDWIGKLK